MRTCDPSTPSVSEELANGLGIWGGFTIWLGLYAFSVCSFTMGVHYLTDD